MVGLSGGYEVQGYLLQHSFLMSGWSGSDGDIVRPSVNY